MSNRIQLIKGIDNILEWITTDLLNVDFEGWTSYTSLCYIDSVINSHSKIIKKSEDKNNGTKQIMLDHFINFYDPNYKDYWFKIKGEYMGVRESMKLSVTLKEWYQPRIDFLLKVKRVCNNPILYYYYKWFRL